MNRMLVRSVACLLIVAVVLPGCATMKKPTAIGALAGAAVGAGVGAAVDHDKRGRGALIGAATGAAVGGGIGYLIERQRKDIENIPDADVEVQNKEGQDQLLVTLEGTLLFDRDSFVINSGSATLDGLADNLNKYPESRVVVKGYTDNRGTEEHNLKLSQRRADAVKTYLISKQVHPDRITAVGFGKSFPVASNDSEEGRRQNRRVELEIIPTKTS